MRLYKKYKYSTKATKISAAKQHLIAIICGWALSLCLVVTVISSLILIAIVEDPSHYVQTIMPFSFIMGITIGIIHAIHLSSIDTDDYALQDVKNQIETGIMEEETLRMINEESLAVITIAYIYHKLDRKYEISEIIRQIEEFDFNDEIGFLYATFNLCEATNFFEKLAQSNTKEEK